MNDFVARMKHFSSQSEYKGVLHRVYGDNNLKYLKKTIQPLSYDDRGKIN